MNDITSASTLTEPMLLFKVSAGSLATASPLSVTSVLVGV